MEEIYYQEQQATEQAPMTGYALHRGLMKLSALFSLSLCATILSRLFPALIPALAVLVGTAAFGLITYIFIKKGDQSIQLALISVSVAGGIIGGSWDGISQAKIDGNTLFPIVGVGILMGLAIMSERAVSSKRRDGNEF